MEAILSLEEEKEEKELVGRPAICTFIFISFLKSKLKSSTKVQNREDFKELSIYLRKYCISHNITFRKL